MTRIARFVPVPVIGGVGVSVLAYWRLIDRVEFATDFFVQEAMPESLVREIEAAGGRVHVVPRFSHPLAFLRMAVRLLKSGAYDIAHANMSTLSALPLLAARLAGIPVRIAHSHTTSTFREPVRHLAKLALRPFANALATHYAACSENAACWQFGASRVKAGKVCVLHTAIEMRRFAFDAETRLRLRGELGYGPNDIVIGLVGRLVTQKNPVRMVRILGAIARIRPSTRLLVVGDGPLADAMRTEADRFGLRDRVTFVGRKADPSPYYNAMDVFAFPSLYEGLGRVLVEAQINGLRSVASDAVPQEAKVSQFVEFVSLAASDEKWAAAFCRAADAGRTAQDMMSTVADAGYDITREARRNAEFYRSALAERA